ncbi:MAG: hypothetical protein ABSA34_04370 [Candidatus Goldiibacteriota bacterium]
MKKFVLLFTGFILISLTVFLGCQNNNPASASASSSYNGTYNWSLTNVGGINSSCSSCVFINNGQISNTDGSFSNLNIDSFGNISFNGPCPTGGVGPGYFSGKSGGLSRPQWSGTWTCAGGDAGGPNSIWTIYQGSAPVSTPAAPTPTPGPPAPTPTIPFLQNPTPCTHGCSGSQPPTLPTPIPTATPQV